MRRSRSPDLWTAGFRLSLPTSVNANYRAVRSLLLMRSLTDAIEIYTGMGSTSVRVAQTMRNCRQKRIRKRLSSF